MNIEQLYQLFLKYPKITTDSRNIEEGSLFFALKGPSFDGNSYAVESLNRGAAYAIIDNEHYNDNEKCILVEDVLKTLQLLAKHHRKILAIPVLGITGTNGKTTTKELIAKVLSVKFNVHCTKGNLNNHIGVPLTLLELNSKHDFAVIEMGASKLGDIHELCEIADPDMGIISNIGRAHLEGFGSLDGVVKTKTELYQYINDKKDGVLFVNSNDDLLVREAANYKINKKIYYGQLLNDFCLGYYVSAVPFVSIDLVEGNKKYRIDSKLIGDYNVNNILAAACVGKHVGISFSDIAEAIQSYNPLNNRSQLMQTKTNSLIIDCYNANPSSMSAAIESFLSIITTKDKVLILGDMLELGNYADEEHCNIINLLMHKIGITVFLVGSVFNKNAKGTQLKYFSSTEELKKFIDENPIKNSFVLIKGSRGIKLEKIIDSL